MIFLRSPICQVCSEVSGGVLAIPTDSGEQEQGLAAELRLTSARRLTNLAGMATGWGRPPTVTAGKIDIASQPLKGRVELHDLRRR